MAVGAHDDQIGSSIDGMLSQYVSNPSPSARDAVDPDVDSVACQICRDVCTGFLSVDSDKRYGIHQGHMQEERI